MDGVKEHEYCLRCGRKLKNPIARQIGYGTVCIKKMKTSLNNRPLIPVGIEKSFGKTK